jgi:hypothetical protein
VTLSAKPCPESSRSVARFEALPRFSAIVEAALEGDHVKDHLLMQELDEAGLGVEGRTVAVRLLAELHDTRVADQRLERLEITEVAVAGIDCAHRDGVFAEPVDARASIVGADGVQAERERRADRRHDHGPGQSHVYSFPLDLLTCPVIAAAADAGARVDASAIITADGDDPRRNLETPLDDAADVVPRIGIDLEGW